MSVADTLHYNTVRGFKCPGLVMVNLHYNTVRGQVSNFNVHVPEIMLSADIFFDYFAIFLTTIVEQFDPHTNYMAPPDKDRFDQRMSGKLEGVGARLQKKKDYINVIEVISGGPAWRGEHIEVGDVLLKVRQQDEVEPVSIVGMRIDDAVKLIKGPKGSKVILTVKGVDGSIREETVERGGVDLNVEHHQHRLAVFQPDFEIVQRLVPLSFVVDLVKKAIVDVQCFVLPLIAIMERNARG